MPERFTEEEETAKSTERPATEVQAKGTRTPKRPSNPATKIAELESKLERLRLEGSPPGFRRWILQLSISHQGPLTVIGGAILAIASLAALPIWALVILLTVAFAALMLAIWQKGMKWYVGVIYSTILTLAAILAIWSRNKQDSDHLGEINTLMNGQKKLEQKIADSDDGRKKDDADRKKSEAEFQQRIEALIANNLNLRFKGRHVSEEEYKKEVARYIRQIFEVPEMSEEGRVTLQAFEERMFINLPPSGGHLVYVGGATPSDSIIFDGGLCLLDNHFLENVVFKNAVIVYRGGPVGMNNVRFINCIPEMLDAPPDRKAKVKAVYDGLSPQVEIPPDAIFKHNR